VTGTVTFTITFTVIFAVPDKNVTAKLIVKVTALVTRHLKCKDVRNALFLVCGNSIFSVTKKVTFTLGKVPVNLILVFFHNMVTYSTVR
jgi:hypothetical protein